MNLNKAKYENIDNMTLNDGRWHACSLRPERRRECPFLPLLFNHFQTVKPSQLGNNKLPEFIELGKRILDFQWAQNNQEVMLQES